FEIGDSIPVCYRTTSDLRTCARVCIVRSDEQHEIYIYISLYLSIGAGAALDIMFTAKIKEKTIEEIRV
ncbi:hypothetical protein ACJX0J_040763, partial [Zea mays]